MPDEETQGPGFTIVDKRDEDGGAADAEQAAQPLPPVDFPGFLISLATSALYHLGLVPDPTTGEIGPKNTALARHTIDTIELLQRKTQGNLTDEEEKLLRELLTELRMRFVEAGSS